MEEEEYKREGMGCVRSNETVRAEAAEKLKDKKTKKEEQPASNSDEGRPGHKQK
jgi:hypothetical protein